MNRIPVIQNSEKQLQRLAAQRELYSAAKKLHVFQIFATVLVPVILATIALYYNPFSVPAAIFGVISFVTDIAFIEPAIKKKKEKAAKIQELFDCEVLDLPKFTLKIVDDITVEVVLQHYDAHAKIKTNIEKIKNWYSVEVGRLPLHIARIVCQRTNCWWDSKLRKKYAFVLKFIALTVFAIILIIAYCAKLTLVEVTLIASGLVPFFQFCIKQANDNIEASCRLDQLIQFIVHLWERALSGADPMILTEESRKLQDEIFEHRSKSPLILDSYYKLFLDKDEALMNKTSEILVEEAIQKLHL